MTTNSTKLTQKVAYSILATIVEESEHEKKEELLAFIEKKMESVEKKASTPTKTQKENETYMENVVEALAEIGRPVTVSELMKIPSLSMHSNQKLSALLRKLVEGGQVVKTTEKKVSYFSLA